MMANPYYCPPNCLGNPIKHASLLARGKLARWGGLQIVQIMDQVAHVDLSLFSCLSYSASLSIVVICGDGLQLPSHVFASVNEGISMRQMSSQNTNASFICVCVCVFLPLKMFHFCKPGETKSIKSNWILIDWIITIFWHFVNRKIPPTVCQISKCLWCQLLKKKKSLKCGDLHVPIH